MGPFRLNVLPLLFLHPPKLDLSLLSGMSSLTKERKWMTAGGDWILQAQFVGNDQGRPVYPTPAVAGPTGSYGKYTFGDFSFLILFVVGVLVWFRSGG